MAISVTFILIEHDPDWIDITLHKRQIAFDGDTLIITTLPQIGIDGKLCC